MKTLLKSSFKQRRAWWLVSALLVLFCRAVLAQTTLISNQTGFNAVLADKSVTVITNFMTNSIISLTTSGQRININRSLVIDGGTNGVTFTGNGVERIFTVATNCQLTLYNLQIINGQSTNGGAIYNLGTLIISNCIIAGNAATNFSGVTGTTNSNGNGGNGTSGGTAEGGAIYSLGPVSIYNSVVGTNTALGGAGGSGGTGANGLIFGSFGGNAGSGGSAFGAAVYASGSSNVFVSSQFLNNTCTAGTAGNGGAGGSGSGLSGTDGGAGAPGGSTAGGAIYVTGSGAVFVTNCIFAENTITAGASGADGTGNNNGFTGGVAEGGGVYIYGTVTNAYFENSVFFQNTCTSGAGGSVTGSGLDGGNGGTAAGGGLTSAARLTILRNCTLATNTLVAGAGGSGTSANGSSGGVGGWDIYGVAGVTKLTGSILSGGTNASPNLMPNALRVTDAGYNISSDASLVRSLGDTTLIDSTNTFLDSGLAADGPDIGPSGLANPPQLLTLAIVTGSDATNFVPGVPGLTFPQTDELGNPRGTPASAGAFELTPITIDTNAPPPTLSPITGVVDGLTSTSTNIDAHAGNTVTMSVSATNNDPNNNLGFQWQLNGTNLTDNNTFMGTTTSNLTIETVGLADQGAYQVIASVSLLENATTSSVVSLGVITTTRITAQPISKPKVPNGSVVTFSVSVIGTQPLSYQWFQITSDGSVTNMLTDGNEISGSTNSTLVINPATTNDEGSYFVEVTNAFSEVTSVKALLGIGPDVGKPTVVFSTLPGARQNDLVVTGKATDDAQVTSVNYWITNVNAGNVPTTTTDLGLASLSTTGTTTKTWAISNVFLPGTNYVTVQSVDFAGRVSPFETREFFNESPALFTLTATGSGTVTGTAPVAGDVKPANGAMLNIGEGYTLTAHPGKNYILSNWVSSTGFISNSPTLHFIMESNLIITANFTPNLFIGASGVYNGLFYQPGNVTEQTAGMLKSLKIGPAGTYTGTLMLGGIPHTLVSSFNSSGYASNYIKRTTAQGGSLAVEMTLDWTSGEISGSVSNDVAGWDSPLEAEKSAGVGSSAEYTVLLDPGTNVTGEIPPGSGYMLITNHNGSVILSGALADGTTFNQAPPLGVMGDVPVYASLYGNGGLLLGWLGLSNGTVEAEAPMAWIKPAARSGIYTAGFTNYLLVTGSGWTNPPPKTSAVSLSDGSLMITNADLDLDFTISITNDIIIEPPDVTTNPANSLTGTVAPKTGLLTVTFGNGIGRETTIGHGAMLQNSTNGGGYFVTKTSAGAILVSP
jgi:hypothetical protein